MSISEIESKVRELRQLQALIEVSAPMIKCKKTPRKKCRFMAEEAKKR